ncbi:MAG: succinate--CoA ligase subunit alpha [Candidatus Aerophobetes bacterium]|nr:succinate--CoA ligase subunit alpha [Candidatus Aerophobetes bacterium]
MAILVDENTRVIVQGMTGRVGSRQTRLMLDYGTKIVAGVTPGKGGERVYEVPVYDSVKEAKEKHHIDASVVFVPARFVKDSCFEAIDAGIRLIVLVTEHTPVYDAMQIKAYSKANETMVIGPTTPGIISPAEKIKIGILPGNMFCPGNIGLISRSGTLTYEIAANLCDEGIGQSSAVGMGADPVVCTNLVDLLKLFDEDNQTKVVAIVGEVGGTEEEIAAQFIKEKMSKPVVAYIAGRSVPPGKRMGHAGAIVERGRGSAESKMEALREAKVKVAEMPQEIAQLVKEALNKI